jgi:hypothetical protein
MKAGDVSNCREDSKGRDAKNSLDARNSRDAISCRTQILEDEFLMFEGP